jgi:hypothetical protein
MMVKRSVSKLVVFAAVGVAGLFAAFMFGRYFQNLPRDLSAKPSVVDLALDAVTMNKTLPEMVSDGVQLDRTSAGPGNTFNYFYTIVDDEQARDLATNPSRLEELSAQLQDRVCEMMPNYVEHGVVVKYFLKNRLGAALPTIAINSFECKSRSAKG